MISHTGKITVRVNRLMDEFARREDGSESVLLADTRFDNHEKMTIEGIVMVGTDTADRNPLEDGDMIMPRCHNDPVGYVLGDVFDIDIRKGDRVFFHYLCAENKASMDRNVDGSWDLYMQTSDIFCLIRNGKMIMNTNWVLGYKIEQPKLQLVDVGGVEIRAELTAGKGVSLVKGMEISPYVDEAEIGYINQVAYRNVAQEVFTAMRVYLSKDSSFANNIEGKKSLLFRHTDILAVYAKNNEDVVPVGAYHLVRVNPNEYKSTVIKHTVIVKAPEWATIIRSGKACVNGKPGEKVIFSRRWTRLLSMDTWLIADGEIQAVVD